ncbi:hypothetical protein [Pelagibacterium luteolum]|uniref:Uncharacterized protein n=1 Tax=Pelagibacterium luteolum TaxID=440168 RepID=A0A1G7TNJ1_9HYPH|nr:hypothetical protein [Pelagibacterium luteolum]SDG36050.1 hypothetical protein SAMN04487974_102201 [Pelagibacterium luteolum]
MALTKLEIERALGPIEPHLAAEIAAIDATVADLVKALAWLQSDEALVNDGDHLPTGAVAELIGILETADDEDSFDVPASGEGDWAQQ